MDNKPQFGLVVEYVKDVEASRRFYVDVLGLEVERQHPAYVQFNNFAITSDEPIGGRDEVELYWLVSDAEAAYQELSQKAEVVLPLTRKPFGTMFGVRNADGRPRYLLEFAKERPSRPA